MGNANKNHTKIPPLLAVRKLPSRTPKTTNIDENAGKKNPHTLLVYASTTTMENNMEATVKTKYRSDIWSINITPRDIPEGT
jgi:hypothetical protein